MEEYALMKKEFYLINEIGVKIIKIVKKTVITILVILGTGAIVTFLYMRQDKFGKNPSGKKLERLASSPHYKNGQFKNLSYTPQFGENYSIPKIIYEQVFKKSPNQRPIDRIPGVKTNLHDLDTEQNVLIWFGHSSYFMQIDGIRILVDPVFSGNASPLPNSVKSFKGTDIYGVADLPGIDYLLISHDHYDHLDYETLLGLKGKVENVICGLGVGAHFEHWGYDPNKIIEKDWYEDLEITNEFKVFVEPARHFSGRGLKRNPTLWVSYVLQTPSKNIYIGGDSGYDTHYADIGSKYGPFDLVILENGQYNKAWPYIHERPEEVLKAAQDLQAKRIFPVHSSKFSLSNHPWNEPLSKLTELNKTYNFPLVTPVIGEIVNLENANQRFEQWWVGLK